MESKQNLCNEICQVIRGGNCDVNVALEGPNEEIIYKKLHKQYDNIHFETNVRELKNSKTSVSHLIQLIKFSSYRFIRTVYCSHFRYLAHTQCVSVINFQY